MAEFIRHANDVVAAHHRVSGMNFIPGGYTISAAVWVARVEAKNQLIASGAGESKTESPSLADDNEFLDTPANEDLPPTRPDEVHIGSPHQDAGCPLA